MATKTKTPIEKKKQSVHGAAKNTIQKTATIAKKPVGTAQKAAKVTVGDRKTTNRTKHRTDLQPIKDKQKNLVSIKDHTPASSKPGNLVSIKERKKPYNSIPSIAETKQKITEKNLVSIKDKYPKKARNNKYNY